MEAIYIINLKTSEVLVSKEFKTLESSTKLNTFLQELPKILSNEKSPTVLINNSIFVYTMDNGVLFLSIVSEDNIIVSIYKVLETIRNVIKLALGAVTVNLIRDNFIHILLMIDQYMMDGVPIFHEENVLASMISPIGITDKITENIIGKNKDYKCTTLNNFIRESQTNYDVYKYKNDNLQDEYKILFNFTDNLDLVYDKNFNLLSKIVFSELNVLSSTPENMELSLLVDVPFEMFDFSFDSTVSTKKKEFKKSKNIDCITRHGNYTLSKFIPVTNSVSLPFKVNLSGNQSGDVYSISVTIELVSIRDLSFTIDNMNVNIYFPDHFQNSNLSVNNGEFEFTSKEKGKVGKWTIPKLNKTTNSVNLKGNLLVDSSRQGDFNCVLNLSCTIDLFNVTNGKVSKVTILKNPKDLKIYKGAKQVTNINNLEILF